MFMKCCFKTHPPPGTLNGEREPHKAGVIWSLLFCTVKCMKHLWWTYQKWSQNSFKANSFRMALLIQRCDWSVKTFIHLYKFHLWKNAINLPFCPCGLQPIFFLTKKSARGRSFGVSGPKSFQPSRFYQASWRPARPKSRNSRPRRSRRVRRRSRRRGSGPNTWRMGSPFISYKNAIWAMKDRSGCLGYIGDETLPTITHLHRDLQLRNESHGGNMVHFAIFSSIFWYIHCWIVGRCQWLVQTTLSVGGFCLFSVGIRECTWRMGSQCV